MKRMDTKMNIEKKILKIINDIYGDIILENLSNKEINLVEDLEFDSIKIVTLIVEIEYIFEIIIPDEYLDIKNIANISNLVVLIEKMLNG